MKTSLYAIGAMMLATTSAMASDPIGESASTKPSSTGSAELTAADRSPMPIALKRTVRFDMSDADNGRGARQWSGNDNEG